MTPGVGQAVIALTAPKKSRQFAEAGTGTRRVCVAQRNPIARAGEFLEDRGHLF